MFDAAAKLNVGFYLGYAALSVQNGKKHRFNTSIIVDSSGMGDEVVTTKINLDRCKELRENVFNFALHREPGDYAEICLQK